MKSITYIRTIIEREHLDPQDPKPEEERLRAKAYITYLKRMTDKMGRALKEHMIEVTFTVPTQNEVQPGKSRSLQNSITLSN